MKIWNEGERQSRREAVRDARLQAQADAEKGAADTDRRNLEVIRNDQQLQSLLVVWRLMTAEQRAQLVSVALAAAEIKSGAA